MTTTFSPFMLTQMASGFNWAAGTPQIGLALLHQQAAVGPSTPQTIAGLVTAPGFQEVSTSALYGSPTYVRSIQTSGQTPAFPVTAETSQAVTFAADYAPIPTGPTAKGVSVAAGVWYWVGTVAGVVNPWILISDDMFGNVVNPGAKITASPRQLFSYVVHSGGTVTTTAGIVTQVPGTLPWESSRTQHVYLLPQRVNWIPNPSFEDVGNFGWRANGAITRMVGGVDNPGNHFLRVAGTTLESISVPRYAQYRLSAWVRSAGGSHISLGLVSLDDTYTAVTTTYGVQRPLYGTWSRYDDILGIYDDIMAVTPHILADGAFDIDLVLLENMPALHDYWDGDSNTGLPGDFSWQGPEAQSYSFWYNDRYVTAARLFGEYTTGFVSPPSLVGDWLPTGTAIMTHWDVLSAQDTKHPLNDWGNRLF